MKRYYKSIMDRSRQKRAMALVKNAAEHSALRFCLFLAAAVVVLSAAGTLADAGEQRSFASAEEAVNAFVAAERAHDTKELMEIFGPDAKELISSGDPVSDKQRRERFVSRFDRKNSLIKEGDRMVLTIGEQDWPFPIPLAKRGDRWFFDTKAGKDEIVNRRIGRNELNTIQTMLAIVDAEREYALEFHEYAEKFGSDPGKKNGLFWETKEGEAPSPLGELVADARAEGYTKRGSKDKPIPYHGYYFRMLKKQGQHAPEGAFDYVVGGRQIGGFAVVAYPAEYGNSGVMTFIVNHEGVVYQKDLGKETAKTAKAMTAYDPNESWKKTE